MLNIQITGSVSVSTTSNKRTSVFVNYLGESILCHMCDNRILSTLLEDRAKQVSQYFIEGITTQKQMVSELKLIKTILKDLQENDEKYFVIDFEQA